MPHPGLLHFQKYTDQLRDHIQHVEANFGQNNSNTASLGIYLQQSLLDGEYLFDHVDDFQLTATEQEDDQADAVVPVTLREQVQNLISQLGELKVIYSKSPAVMMESEAIAIATGNNPAQVASTLVDQDVVYKFFSHHHKLLTKYLRFLEKVQLYFRDFFAVGDYDRGKESTDYNQLQVSIEELTKHQQNTSVDVAQTVQQIILQINIAVCELDIKLDCSRDTIKHLREMQEALTEHIEPRALAQHKIVAQLLQDKCSFLLAKIFLRLHKLVKDEQDDESSRYLKLYREEEKRVKFYGPLLTKAYEHHCSRDFTNGKTLIRKIGKSDITGEELHRLSKYLKKHEEAADITRLEAAVLSRHLPYESLLHELGRETMTFDMVAGISEVSLCRNNALKMKIIQLSKDDFKLFFKEAKGNVIALLEKLLDEVVATDESYKLVDYYPYRELMDFISEFYKLVVVHPILLLSDSDQKDLEKGEDLREVAQKYKRQLEDIEKVAIRAYNHFQKNLRKSQTLHYKPFYVCFSQTFVQDKPVCLPRTAKPAEDLDALEEMRLHVSSSYILPLSFHTISEEYQNFKKRNKELIENIQMKLDSVAKMKYFEKSFRKEIENKEFKLVQALAMFITLASLALATIKSFDRSNIREIMITIMMFGCVLLLFNYFIYWFIRVDKNMTWREGGFFGILLVMLGGLYWLSTFEHVQTQQLQQALMRLDSVQAVQHERFDTVTRNQNRLESNQDDLRQRLERHSRSVDQLKRTKPNVDSASMAGPY